MAPASRPRLCLLLGLACLALAAAPRGATAPTLQSGHSVQQDVGRPQGVDPREVPARGFISSRPARFWEEALISGNGRMGALVMSRPLDEQIILSHERLFLPLHEPLPPVDTASSLPRIRRLMRDGRYQEAADLVVDESIKENYGPKRWTDPFIPAFDLLVRMAGQGEVRRYLRSIDFSTGIAAVRWEDSRGIFRRRLFVSRADNVVVLSIDGPAPGSVDCELELAQHPVDRVNSYWREGEKFALIGLVETSARASWLTYRSSFRKSEGGYQGAARISAKGGMAITEGTKVVVKGADQVLVVLRIEILDKFRSSDAGALKNAVAAVTGDFDTLLARHGRIHGELFDRVTLDLGGGADRRRTSEDLIAGSSVERPSMALLEKAFDAGRYAILSSSGDWPPNLQGVWTGTWGAPWSGDYTLNGNLQTAIASLLDGNMPECLEPFFRYIESLVPASRANAERLYGARGILVASRTSTHGFNNHFDKTWPMTFWTAGAGWMAHFFYDYYLYTGDRNFLAERALPFMKEAALFYEDFLVEGEDGRYQFNPSYSPENNPGNSPSQATINATMDIAVARELLRNLIEACETLKVERASVERWRRMLGRMPAYAVNADGALKEWAWPTLDDNYEHRHGSHLYPLFYALSPEIAESPALVGASRRAIELRMKERARQGGGEMGFGLIQLGQAATSLGDGETTDLILRWLANRYYYASLASAHNPGPDIFNVDISGGLPDLVIRALVQSAPGRIDLLPALPRSWLSGRIGGVLARGQVIVRLLEWSQTEAHVVLSSKKAQVVTVTLPGGIARRVTLPEGKDIALTISTAK